MSHSNTSFLYIIIILLIIIIMIKIGLNGWQRGNVGCLFLSTAAAVLIKEVQRCWEGRSAAVHCSVAWSSVVQLSVVVCDAECVALWLSV